MWSFLNKIACSYQTPNIVKEFNVLLFTRTPEMIGAEPELDTFQLI